ncbi:putative biotin carboxylase [Helianthus annuus]|nr:putative biotin carboxylase [Helianthus annuus]
MRLAKERDEFVKLLQQAQSEAAAAFGNDGVYLEKCIQNPRHNEIRVLLFRMTSNQHPFMFRWNTEGSLEDKVGYFYSNGSSDRLERSGAENVEVEFGVLLNEHGTIEIGYARVSITYHVASDYALCISKGYAEAEEVVASSLASLTTLKSVGTF